MGAIRPRRVDEVLTFVVARSKQAPMLRLDTRIGKDINRYAVTKGQRKASGNTQDNATSSTISSSRVYALSQSKPAGT